MKKFALVLATVSMALVCALAAGCSLFASAPKVAGCTYVFDKVEYESDDTLTTEEQANVTTLRATYLTNETGMTIAFSNDGKVTYTSALNVTNTYDYEQRGVNIIVPEGPYKFTNDNGTIVCAYSITKSSNEVLKLHHAMSFNGTGHVVHFYLTYSLVQSPEAE